MDSLTCLDSKCLELLQKHQLLQPLVRAEIITSEIASVQADIDVEYKLLEGFQQTNSLQDEDKLELWLKANKLTREQLIEKLLQPYKLTKHCQENFSLKAEARFLERKLHLDKIVYSLLRFKDPFQAREMYLRIADGEADFGDLAAEFSEGREKQTRGIIGPVALSQAHPQLVNLLRCSKPGVLCEPVHIEGWNLVVRVESYQAASLEPSIELQMAQELFGEWVEEEVERKINTLIFQNSSAIVRSSIEPVA